MWFSADVAICLVNQLNSCKVRLLLAVQSFCITCYTKGQKEPRKVRELQWSVVSILHVHTLSLAKVENLEDVRLFFLLFFLALHNNYQVFWHSLGSEGLRFRNMNFLHLSSLTHSLQTLSRSSLSSRSFSVCFTSVLTWSWKRAWSLGVCLFRLFLSLCVHIFLLYLNLNLPLLFVLTREHACRHMQLYVIFVFWDSPYILFLFGKTLHYLFTFFTDPIPLAWSGNSLTHHNCISQKWRMCF